MEEVFRQVRELELVVDLNPEARELDLDWDRLGRRELLEESLASHLSASCFYPSPDRLKRFSHTKTQRRK